MSSSDTIDQHELHGDTVSHAVSQPIPIPIPTTQLGHPTQPCQPNPTRKVECRDGVCYLVGV